MRRKLLNLAAACILLAALPGCNLRNAESLAAAGVAVAGATAIGFTVDSLVNSAAQRNLQRQQFELQKQRELFYMQEQQELRLAAERRERFEQEERLRLQGLQPRQPRQGIGWGS